MLLYDTLSQQKKGLIKPGGRPINLFVCGPTVYDYAQIGNARTYIVFDAFVRYLRGKGFDVFYLQNITDIDDKIIARAKEENKSPKELADFFLEKYIEDMKTLGIESVSKYAPATEFIPQIVKQVVRLKEEGYAYEITGDGYYFDISKFKNYGKLSHRTALQAEDSITRIDENIKKRNRGDFCLWKFSKPDEPFWETSLGAGRPGWHIEDTAISEDFFGPQYDIHGGGVDLKFPHHEAEIAQQESASGKIPFVNFWMHTGFLLAGGQKMSKSLNNFITIRDFLKNYKNEKDGAAVLRLMILNSHYRSPLNYNEKIAAGFENTWKGIKNTLDHLLWLSNPENAELIKKYVSKGQSEKPLNIQETKELVKNLKDQFFSSLEDDFNTPSAFASLFPLISSVDAAMASDMKSGDAQYFYKEIKSLLEALGFELPKNPAIPSKVKKLLAQRELCRVSKQFVQADALRKEIDQLGYSLEDTPLGPWLKQI